jgi:hypothetical protein
MSDRNDLDERRVAESLGELWRSLPTPSEDELHAIAGTASAEHRVAGASGRSGGRRVGSRWAVAVVAVVALLAGSGLGFGLGSRVTPSGTAGGNFIGFGFLPVRGWNVMQSGTLDRTGATRAIAANVPLAAADDVRREPLHTLRTLSGRGVVISVSFRSRGDAGVDARFPVRDVPLRIADARSVSSSSGMPVSAYLLRAALGGYNVEAHIYFGATVPTAAELRSAQRQLNRLVVAAAPVTIFARPTIVPARDPWTTVFGSVESAKAGEAITIQVKDCGSDVFRTVEGATTQQGGGWSTQYSPGISTVLRAVWDGKASNQVSVRQRPWVSLRRLPRGPWQVTAGSTPRGGMPGGPQASFWGRRVLVQRLDQRLGVWRTVKRAVLRSDGAEFRLALPRGTRIRAVLSLSEARPCYLEGVSFTVRV